MSSRLLLHGSLVTLALLLPALVGVACGTTERLNPADFSPPDGGTSTSSSATSTGATGSGGAGGASSTTTTTATTSAGGGNGGNGGASSSSGVGGSGGSVASSTAGVGGGASGSGGAGGMGSGAAASGSGGAGGVGSAAGTTASTAQQRGLHERRWGQRRRRPPCATPSRRTTRSRHRPTSPSAARSRTARSLPPPVRTTRTGPRFKTYSAPIPAGYWVHSLEHGAVVILYNCPNGCDAELAALDAYLAAIPADPLCVPPLAHRYIVVPDPTLPFTFAAAAWGNGLTSSCFDLPALGAFISAHYAMAPENFCFQGTDLEALDGGIPCGSIDAGADGG
jgi:hypothetical protein